MKIIKQCPRCSYGIIIVEMNSEDLNMIKVALKHYNNEYTDKILREIKKAEK